MKAAEIKSIKTCTLRADRHSNPTYIRALPPSLHFRVGQHPHIYIFCRPLYNVAPLCIWFRLLHRTTLRTDRTTTYTQHPQPLCDTNGKQPSGSRVNKGSPLYEITHRTTLWADITTAYTQHPEPLCDTSRAQHPEPLCHTSTSRGRPPPNIIDNTIKQSS